VYLHRILHVIGILHTYGAHKRQSRLMKHADETVILRSIRTPSQKTRTKGVATRHVRGMRTRLLIHRGWGHCLPNGRRALHTPTPRHVMTHSALLSRNRVHGHSPFALHRLCHSTCRVSFSVVFCCVKYKTKWTLPSHTPLTQWKEEVVILACIHSHTHAHTHKHKHHEYTKSYSMRNGKYRKMRENQAQASEQYSW
jgi:hypothetical protein